MRLDSALKIQEPSPLATATDHTLWVGLDQGVDIRFDAGFNSMVNHPSSLKLAKGATTRLTTDYFARSRRLRCDSLIPALFVWEKVGDYQEW